MRKKVQITFINIVLVTVLCLTACGGYATSGESVSGSAVSVEAVSGSAVEVKREEGKSETKGKNCSRNCIYMEISSVSSDVNLRSDGILQASEEDNEYYMPAYEGETLLCDRVWSKQLKKLKKQKNSRSKG